MKNKRRWSKGEMSKTIVVHCVRTLTWLLVWAVLLKSVSAVVGWDVDLSDVLTYAAAAFGGELLLLAFKRVFTKDRGEES